MKEYLYKLIKQYMDATGVKNLNINSQNFIKEFSEWVKNNRIIGKEYTSFIEYMGAQPTVTNEGSVEIGKGKYDSIALDMGIDMITPYSFGIKRTDGGIITADFNVFESTPLIVKHNKDGNQFETIDTQYERRFMTHNPYEPKCIKNWEQLHNAGDNITVGVFGSIYDKDLEHKIGQVKLLKDSLNDASFKEDYVTDKDNYYYAVSSSRKVKVLTKH